MKLKLRTHPYPHQAQAMRRAVKKGNYAFFFEPRCGKTKAALDSIAVQRHRGVVKKVAVIAPLIALQVWEDQIAEHYSLSSSVSYVDTDEYIKSHRNGSKLTHFWLCNYDKFSRRGNERAYENGYIEALEAWGPDLIVLDESHRVKSSGAVRSQALWRMVRRLRDGRGDRQPFVYLLSGTPNPKGYIDLFSQFRILDEKIFGTQRAEFEAKYMVKGQGKYAWRVLRYRNVEKIKAKVNKVASIVTSEDAGLEGVRIFNPIRIDLPDKIRGHYIELATELVTQIEDATIEAKNAGVRRLRLLQLTGGFTTEGVSLHDAKLRAARDYLVDLIEQDEHVVVYARFLQEVYALEKLCKAVGYQTNAIYGAVRREDRAAFISDFQRARRPSALVFQVSSGSLAIELTAAAEELFYSLPDSWETFFQCLERVRGPKQHRPVKYSFIVARGTVDMGVLESLREKRDMHRSMMGNPKRFLLGM